MRGSSNAVTYKSRSRDGGKRKSSRRVAPYRPPIKQHSRELDEGTLNTLSGTVQRLWCMRIEQGTDDYERIGNQIKALGLRVKGVLHNNGSSEALVRMLVLKYRVADIDVTSTSTNIFDPNTPTSIASSPGLDTMVIPIDRGYFTVLLDRVFQLGPVGGAGASPATVQFSEFVKLNHTVRFLSNADTSVSEGRVDVIFFSAEGNDDTTAGTVQEVSAFSTLYFTD